MAEPGLKVLSLTHVEYQQGDPLAKAGLHNIVKKGGLGWDTRAFAVFSLLPLVIVIVFLTTFFLRRDLHTLTYGLGVIINYVANSALKRYIAEPRPRAREVQFEEFGMPSSHSQFMWFCSSYLVLFTLCRLHCSPLWKTVSLLGAVVAAAAMSYSRVYLQYHTAAQVVWGGLAGGLGALLWFLLTQLVFSPLYPSIERWRVSEYFMIRDTSAIPNILWFEYVTIRGEVNNRKKATARKNN